MEKKDKADERQFISKENLSSVEKDMIVGNHIKRYSLIRRFCYGKVLDLACGCGYGSYLVAGNPDVTSVTGVDIDQGSISWAQKEYSTPKNEFVLASSENISDQFDTLVCIETIEHIKDTSTIPNLVERCNINNLIISFPDKKTTHYNKFHMHDFVRQDIIDLFPNHLAYHLIRIDDSVAILFTRLPKNAPHDLFRNILDIK